MTRRALDNSSFYEDYRALDFGKAASSGDPRKKAPHHVVICKAIDGKIFPEGAHRFDDYRVAEAFFSDCKCHAANGGAYGEWTIELRSVAHSKQKGALSKAYTYMDFTG